MRIRYSLSEDWIGAASWPIQYIHPLKGITLRGAKRDKGTLTVSATGVSFRPDQSDGMVIDVLINDLNSASALSLPKTFGIRINETFTFEGLKTRADADAIFDQIDAVMRYAGKFEGNNTAQDACTGTASSSSAEENSPSYPTSSNPNQDNTRSRGAKTSTPSACAA